MAWPTRTWTVNGWEDFKTPGIGPPEGLPDDWRDHKGGVLGDSISYWEAIDNPLYEAAANASGIDWNTFLTESTAEIGTEEDYESTQTPYYVPGLGMEMSQEEFDDLPDGVSKTMMEMANTMPHVLGSGALGIGAAIGGISRDDPDLHDWGIDRSRHGGFAEDLDKMHEWLGKTIKAHSLQDMPIIDRGPQGSDYGIDGDIWAHYGLDKPPKPPKTMDVHYNFNLIEAKPSTMTYATPEGFPVLDTSTESVAYEDTHYASWQAEQAKAYDRWEDKLGDTSYGEAKEVRGSARWKDNVQKIIGKDQDVTAWANAAGVGTLNSRNDSDTIKKVFRDNDGVLPT